MKNIPIPNNEYIRIERVHKGVLFQSLEKGGKRCFPLSKDGIQHCLDLVAESPEGTRHSYASMYDYEPDIWDAIFESTPETTADDIIKRFNILELPPKSNG